MLKFLFIGLCLSAFLVSVYSHDHDYRDYDEYDFDERKYKSELDNESHKNRYDGKHNKQMSGSSNGRYNEQETGDYNERYHKQMSGKFNEKHNKQMSGKFNIKHNKQMSGKFNIKHNKQMSGSSNGRYNEQETGDYNGRYHKQMSGKFNGKHNKQMSGKSNVKHNKLSECQAVFENRLQKLHNDFRRTYNVSPLKLDNKLTNSIKTLTDRMVSSKSLSLTGNKNYGSNKFSSSLYDFSINECESLADRFFDSLSKSAKFYNYNDPGFTSKTGGFTQLVWKSSKQLGCSVSFTDLSKHEKWAYAACYYYPAGNMIGSFEQNVLRPRK